MADPIAGRGGEPPAVDTRSGALDFRLDLQGTILAISAEVDVYGYSRDSLIGTSAEALVHPDDIASFHERLTAHRNDVTRIISFNVRLLDAQQQPHSFRGFARTVKLTPNGHSSSIAVEGQLRPVDTAAAPSSPLWGLLVQDALPMALSHEGVIVHASQPLLDLLRCERDVLIGLPLTQFVRHARDELALDSLLHPDGEQAGPMECFIGLENEAALLVNITTRREEASNDGDLYWLFQPILEPTQVRAAAVEVEQRFRELVELAEESILLIENGVFSDCNRKTEDMFGRPREEMIGLHPADPRLSPPKQPDGTPSLEGANQLVHDAVSGTPQRFVWRHLRADGTPFLAEISLKRISGSQPRLICVQRDITERIKHEEELAASEERFRRIFEDAEIGIVLTDLDGNFLNVNPYFCELLGYDREELLQMSVRLVGFPDDDRHEELALHAELTRGRRRAYKLRKRYRRRDGGEVVADVLVNQFITTDGEINHIGLIQDQTLQLRSEREREELQKQLVQAQKMEEIGRITGGIAHDFNNLLTALQGHTDIADMALQQAPPPVDSLRGYVHEMKQTVQRAANLTRQLLAFSRSQVATPKHLSINGMLKDLHKMLIRVAPATVDIELNLTPSLGSVFIDPTHLTQVILNLSTNAVDAMPDGGVLTFHTSATTVEEDDPLTMGLKTVQPGRYIKLTVEDSGIGVPPETISHIFEPFFTTKEPGKGTGLGLSTSVGLIKSASGYIDVTSEYGVGTRFTILLPRSGDISEEVEDPTETIRGGQERIFVVEDEEIIRRIVERMLSMAGYKTMIFDCAEDALAHIVTQQDWPDLLLTDIVLPNRSGTELLVELREHNPSLKVICMSGYTRDSESLKTVMEDKLPFLPKPFKRQQLLDLIRNVLDGVYEPDNA